MNAFSEITGRRIIILGLARTGFSTASWLKECQIPYIAWDDATLKRQVARRAQNFSLQDLMSPDFEFRTGDILLLSPGIPHEFPKPHPVVAKYKAFCRAQNIKPDIISDIELFLRTHKKARIIAITGTNGKSTTTALMAHCLNAVEKESLIGGNFGIPVFDLPTLGDEGYYVLEISSAQLELTPSLLPEIGILTNITPDHLDLHGGMERYVKAKEKLFHGYATSRMTAIIGVDTNPSKMIFEDLYKKDPSRALAVTVDPKKDLNLKTLKGAHNAQNVELVRAAMTVLNVPQDKIQQGFETFPGLAHRQEWVLEMEGITFINDSKGTNVEATGKALAVFDDIYWILGGHPKNDSLSDLKELFPRIRKAFLIGEATERFAAELEGWIAFEKCGVLERALEQAFSAAQEELRENPTRTPHILLSPACSSFDQFKDFEERGEIFKSLVHSLRKSRGH